MSLSRDDHDHHHEALAMPEDWPRQLIDRFDPRVRILLTIGWSVAVATVDRPDVLLWTLLAAITAAAFLCGTRLLHAVRQLTPLWFTIALLYVLLPITWGRAEETSRGLLVMQIGMVGYSSTGLAMANLAALKAGTIAAVVVALIGTLSAAEATNGLRQLGVPRRLVELMMLTVRYIACLRDEYLRTRRAMRIRAFQPRANRHTYRMLGYVIGMIFVRSHARGQRVIEAMKCRGYTGRLPSLQQRTFSPAYDLPLVAIGASGIFTLVWFGLG